MPAYVIVQLDIHEPEAYQEYLDGFMPSFLRHRGELLASSKQDTEVLEGTWSTPRTVLLQFPSAQHARAWYEDPEYVELRKIRQRTARTNLVLLHGIT